MTQRLSRRALLRRLPAAVAGLPLLRALSARAQLPSQVPKRLLVFFTPNGSVRSAWGGSDARGALALGPILAPLERFRSKLLVLSGLDLQQGGPGDGHQQGMGWLLTGRPLLPGRSAGNCAGCAPASWASGASLDQVIAGAIGADTWLRSLELGNASGQVASARTRLCYAGAADPLAPDDDPWRAFERVFGAARAAPAAEQARRRALGGSVLDYARAELTALEAELSGTDRALVQAHAAHVRALESRLYAEPTERVPACDVPELGAALDAPALARYPHVGELHMDLIAAAFACDLTRVASLQWTHAAGNIAFPWLGIHDRHHDLSHAGDGNAAAQEKLVRINAWYAEQLAHLLAALERVPQAEGTLLDHTLVLWCSELGKGNAHSHRSVPFVLAGDLGGHFSTGRHVDFGGRSHTDLLLSIAQAFGLPFDGFGDPVLGSAPLSELR